MRQTLFTEFASKDKIDVESGVIRGVSVISEGEALGHDVWIDDKTLRQVKSTASEYSGGLKVKMNHYSGIESTVGTLRNFKIRDDKLVADLHLLKSAEAYDRILEMAEEIPESFGLSIVFNNEPEQIDKVNYARCKEIYSADLVDDPAANPSGLFSAKPTPQIMNKKILELLGLDEKSTEQDILAKVTELAKTKEAMCDCGKPGCKTCAGKDKSMETEKAVSTALQKLLGDKFADSFKSLETINQNIVALQKQNENSTALAKKSEIDALVAEASSIGKTIPLDNDDLYTVKDGVITIHTEPVKLRKMLEKLPKSQVALQRRSTVKPEKDGKPLVGEDHIAWMQQKRAEGATQLTEQFKAAGLVQFHN